MSKCKKSHLSLNGEIKIEEEGWTYMYAIFESGGKQYKATAGAIINLELLDIPEGEKVELKNVLMIVDEDQVKIGAPNVENASVVVHLLEYIKGKKITVFKYKKKKGYRRKIGHRQKYVKIQVDEIISGDQPVSEVVTEEVVSNGA